MWNNPQRLNLIAALLGLLAVYLAIHFTAVAAIRSPQFAFNTLRLTGDLRYVKPEAIARAINGRPLGNFFAADLGQIRMWAEDVSWVRRATVRRVWRDRIEVTIEEHRAIARWGDGDEYLVNSHGELFAARLNPGEGTDLPRFNGPRDKVALVAARFAHYRERVKRLAPAGATADLVAITLSPRFSWTLQLADGLAIDLGRGDDQLLDARLQRLVMVYPETLANRRRDFNRVDLRYPQGMALRGPGLDQIEQERLRQDERETRSSAHANAEREARAKTERAGRGARPM